MGKEATPVKQNKLSIFSVDSVKWCKEFNIIASPVLSFQGFSVHEISGFSQ